MNTEVKIIKLEHEKTEIVPTYGGSNVIATYMLRTEQNNILNSYIVRGEIRGIATADLYIQFLDYEPQNNNEETLTAEAIENLLNW